MAQKLWEKSVQVNKDIERFVNGDRRDKIFLCNQDNIVHLPILNEDINCLNGAQKHLDNLRGSNFNKVRYAQVLTEYKYQGFGAQVNNYGIKPNWLQYGFVQLTGGLEWKRHRVLLNARPEFLFATKGKLDQIKFTDPTNLKTLSDAQISSVNQGWLQNDVMNKISVTASLGYEFRIMERVGLGIQLNRVLKSPYKPLQGGIVQNAVADWNTGFRFSYILK